VESFIGKMRDELLNGELFSYQAEAKVLIEQWRKLYIHIRPQSALGYRPPAPEAIEPISPDLMTSLPGRNLQRLTQKIVQL
jgi:transposase InsO family protein